MQEPRIAELPPRTVAVVEHSGPAEAIDETRRPLYRHMVLHELVGGPSILRWLDPPVGARVVDALVVTHAGFEGDEVVRVEHLPGGRHAVLDYEGDPAGLPRARQHLVDWLARKRLRAAGAVLQVHLMDPIDGIVEEQLQVRLG